MRTRNPFIMWTVLLFVPIAIVTACKFNPGCAIEATVTTAVTNELVGGLQCQAPDEVKKDVGAVCKTFGLCKQPVQTGPIAALACPFISDWAVNELANATIPDRWKCNPVDAKAKAIALLTAGCNAIPFLPPPQK